MTHINVNWSQVSPCLIYLSLFLMFGLESFNECLRFLCSALKSFWFVYLVCFLCWCGSLFLFFSGWWQTEPHPVNKSLNTRSTTADSLLIQNHTPALRIQPPVWSLWETGQRCSRGGMMGQEGYSTLQGAPWPHGPLLLPQSPRWRWRPTHPVTRSSSTHGGVWAPIVHLIYSASGWPNVAMPRCRRGAGLRSVSQLFRLGAKTTGELETSAPAI